MPKDLSKKIKIPFEEVFGKQKPSNPDEIIDVVLGYDFCRGHFHPVIKKMTRQEKADINYKQYLKDRRALREYLGRKRYLEKNVFPKIKNNYRGLAIPA